MGLTKASIRASKFIDELINCRDGDDEDRLVKGESMARYKSKMPKVDGAVEEAMSFVDEIKNTLNVAKVKKAFRLGSDIFSAFQPFMEKPTWWNAGRAGIAVGKVLVDDVEVWSENFFDGDEWTEPYSRDFNLTILQVLAKYPFSTLKTAEENSFIRLIDLDGAKVGWTYHSKLNTVDHIYVETDKLQQARDLIKRLLWEQFQGKPLVMRHNRRNVLSTDEPRVVFEIDDAFHPLPSEKATEYAKYLRRCLDADVPRSVMLYGPPGTGKSTMARTLVENLDLRSFRIRVEDVSGLENSTLFEAITIFEPEAVILDDFDRAHAQAALLETLEFFQRHVKLVVATVNDKNNLDEALLRPGRFDELVLVDQMDEAVVRMMLGEYADGINDVRDWPIAFIQEYCKRRRFMDTSEAASSMAELAKRVKRLDRYRDVDVDNWDDLLEGKRAKANPRLKAIIDELAADAKDDEDDDDEVDSEEDDDDAPSTQRSSQMPAAPAMPMLSLKAIIDRSKKEIAQAKQGKRRLKTWDELKRTLKKRLGR